VHLQLYFDAYQISLNILHLEILLERVNWRSPCSPAPLPALVNIDIARYGFRALHLEYVVTFLLEFVPPSSTSE
jgi:hypothetical protein